MNRPLPSCGLGRGMAIATAFLFGGAGRWTAGVSLLPLEEWYHGTTEERSLAVGGPGGHEPIPPGATQEASDRTARPGGPPATPLDDPHGIGTPGGGSEVGGGLAGTNEGDGAPDDDAELSAAMAGEDLDNLPPADEDATAYGGISGGAVGGTPAEGRSSGGTIRGDAVGGIAPGGTHRGDSTIGAKPKKKR